MSRCRIIPYYVKDLEAFKKSSMAHSSRNTRRRQD
jgi:hypothetical protein